MSSFSKCVMDMAIIISILRFKISSIARLLYNTKVKLHVVVVVVLLVAFLSSGVRLAMVSVVFSFSSLSSFFSHYVVYQQSPTDTVCFYSPFFCNSFQVSINAVIPLQFRSCSPYFTFHFLGISPLPVFHLAYSCHI